MHSVNNLLTFRSPERPDYPFCPGCSHSLVNDALDAALAQLHIDPRQVVLVTDIGCVGMSDQYFDVNTFHGLHGRAVTYATGIKLANPELKVIVLMGDGGTGIGGHHLLNAARRNIGITVLVYNNLNFGMTGGEHSVATPHGAPTASTRGGNLERPLDICASVAVNGASWVYRGTAFDKDLPERIAQGIQTPGFALLDLWELCTAYYVPNNQFSKVKLLETMQQLGLKSGVLHQAEYPEYTRAYHEAALSEPSPNQSRPQHVQPQIQSQLSKTTRIVLAGAAGGKIKSTASALALGAIDSGLWATQRDDYPTTVMSGFSVSEIILSREEILYTGIETPDLLAVVSPEGLSKVSRQLSRMDETQTVFVIPALSNQIHTRARIVILDFELVQPNKKLFAVMVAAAMVHHAGLYPLDAFRHAVSVGQPPNIAAQKLKAVEAALQLLPN